MEAELSEATDGLAAAQRRYIADLFTHLLDRPARPRELEHWASILAGGRPEREVFQLFLSGKEYGDKTKVIPGFPSGHFYSPVVDPKEVRTYWERSSRRDVSELHGIDLDIGAMSDFWTRNEECLRGAPFTKNPGGATRYYYSDRRYPLGDALVLMAMINTYRPSRIVEIGSGFSSAVMLDTADHLGLADFQLICIDPFADRLRSLLRPDDARRVTIIEQQVQTLSLDHFESLEADDILFIDSSHVLKTGSDVHYELFSILPMLKPGVLVHFHDIQFPFEYPAEWVFGNRWSWNEIYAVQAFLMFNKVFETVFFTDYFLRHQSSRISDSFPAKPIMVGGSLWLRKAATIHAPT